MPISDPDERARRALVRSVDNLTELVSIIRDDPGDTNPSPIAFQYDPEDLFDMTFSRVGIDNDALIAGFVTGVKIQLPEYKDKVQALLGDLKPGVQIGLVWNALRREIAVAMLGGPASAKSAGGAGKGSKKGTKKNS
ncbi:MAG TPA: hypothetical protein VEY09_10965 [Pyrinomonadaceae bacterium]|nr:hypothetical protein [Pyrinomonadaceae bacterium]